MIRQRIAGAGYLRPVTQFLSFFFVIGLWSGATPMFASPDEPAHMVRAAGIVRGEMSGERSPDNTVTFEVPRILGSPETPGHGVDCYAFKPAQTADCLSVPADVGSTRAPSSASNYPPFFHLVTGVGTLVTSGLTSLYLMRLLNALVCAALLTLALHNVSRLARPGMVVVGIGLAITPMVLFVSGTVNPSGIAATSGIAIWTAALVLLDSQASRPIPRSAALFALPFCVLILTRRDSLLWGGAIAVVVLIITPWDRLRHLLTVPAVWFWGTAIAATAVAQYVIWSDTTTVSFGTISPGGSGKNAFGTGFRYLQEAIGITGWLDTRMPTVVYYGWISALVGLVFAAMALGARRYVVGILAAITLMLGLATYIGYVRFPYFQGRYYLPLAVGIPLISGRAIADTSLAIPSRRFLSLGLGGAFLLHQVSFLHQLRRYSVGSSGTWAFVFDHKWSPTPGPIWLFVVAYPPAVALMMLALASAARQNSSDEAGSTDTISEQLAPV